MTVVNKTGVSQNKFKNSCDVIPAKAGIYKITATNEFEVVMDPRASRVEDIETSVSRYSYKRYLTNFITDQSIAIIKLMTGVIAIFAAAQIVIPIKPVPITLQTLVISIIAFTYTSRLSFVTVLTYIIIGLLGVPVFTKFSTGLHYFLGSTGGYLIGILLATPIMSAFNSKLSKIFAQKWLVVFFVTLVGHIIIFLLGVSWLATIIGIKQAVYSGFIVFIPSGLVKILIFSSLYSYIQGRIKKE